MFWNVLRMHRHNGLLRSHKREIRCFEGLGDDLGPESVHLELTQTNHTQADVATLIENADTKVREAIILFYAHSHTWDNVARKMRTDREALKKSCQRELEKLRDLLKQG